MITWGSPSTPHAARDLPWLDVLARLLSRPTLDVVTFGGIEVES